MDSPTGQPDPAEGDERRRPRLRPREGAEHRFRFARRWEQHRKSRRLWRPWVMLGFDAAVLVFIVLLLKMLLAEG